MPIQDPSTGTDVSPQSSRDYGNSGTSSDRMDVDNTNQLDLDDGSDDDEPMSGDSNSNRSTETLRPQNNKKRADHVDITNQLHVVHVESDDDDPMSGDSNSNRSTEPRRSQKGKQRADQVSYIVKSCHH